jgi:hypothetical protein
MSMAIGRRDSLEGNVAIGQHNAQSPLDSAYNGLRQAPLSTTLNCQILPHAPEWITRWSHLLN